MKWLMYDNISGYVVAISDSEITTIPEGNSVYVDALDKYTVGEELTYAIYVVRDENNNVVALSAVQQSPTAQYLVQELAEKDAKILELQQLVADLASITLGV